MARDVRRTAKERSPEEQEAIWENERLRNREKHIDEPLRRYVEDSPRLTPARAAEIVVGNDRHGQFTFGIGHSLHPAEAVTGNVRHPLQRSSDLMEFLLQSAELMTPEELKVHNEFLAAHYLLACLLRIYEHGVWHERFCFYLRDFVWPRWKDSSVKRSREQPTRKK